MALIIIVMCTFAIFGATAFGKSPRFETFEASLYSMFVILCLDGWTDVFEDVTDAIPAEDQVFSARAFIVAYIVVVSFVLMPGAFFVFLFCC